VERAELKALLRQSGCAVERGEFTYLSDPKWTPEERRQADAAMAASGRAAREGGRGWLGVRTGGTSGGLKLARHDEETLGAAVRGFCEHFGLARVNAVNVLPVHHVSGLMSLVRSAATGGRHVAWDWKRLERGDVPILEGLKGDWVISLVPTQLQRLLSSPATVTWLRKFGVVFLGGGPAWAELTEAAAAAELRVSLSYGMTETAAMVAALRPEEFLSGDRSCGAALPHARIGVESSGVISITGHSVFRGYAPEWRDTRDFVTEDVGALDGRGHLHVHGRRDAVIISGGKKVHPAEVEAALRASGEFKDVAVVGIPDAEWGEIVVACYPAGAGTLGSKPNLETAIARLPAFQRPKRFIPLGNWPRDAQGKISRAKLRQAIALADARLSP
jgi:o-succinylbenzoate---CoA ligase